MAALLPTGIQRPLVAGCGSSGVLSLGHRESNHSAGRQPLRFGRCTAYLVEGDGKHSLCLWDGRVALMIVPVSGTMSWSCGTQAREVNAGQLAVLARTGNVLVSLDKGASALIVQIPRALLQGRATETLNAPHRLSNFDLAVCEQSLTHDLKQVIATMRDWALAGWPSHTEQASVAEKSLIDGLAQALLALDSGKELFTIASSVQRAIARVQQRLPLGCDLGEVAAAAGITVATLRKNFRACLDLSVTEYMRNARLDWARARLHSGDDNRSISEMASAVGFSSGQSFSTAFQRRYGISPSEFRAQAVKVRAIS